MFAQFGLGTDTAGSIRGPAAANGVVGLKTTRGLVSPGVTELVVHMDGGSAKVALHRPQPGRVTLTGPATYVATIEVVRT